jgi:hypothetical protein
VHPVIAIQVSTDATIVEYAHDMCLAANGSTVSGPSAIEFVVCAGG